MAVKLAGRFRINDAEALLTAVLNGQGFALLPTWLVYASIAKGALVTFLPDWEGGIVPDFDQSIWVVYPPKKVVSPRSEPSSLSSRSDTASLPLGTRSRETLDVPLCAKALCRRGTHRLDATRSSSMNGRRPARTSRNRSVVG